MIRWLVLLICLPVHALVLTNGPDANVTAPTNSLVGWQYVADNGPFTAIGPRLACSVQHVGIIEPVFRGELFHISKIIEPPGSDVRFLVLDHDVPGYATLYVSTNWPMLDKLWLVAGGVGTGAVTGGTNFWWGSEGWWPDGTRRLRWGYSGYAYCVADLQSGLDYFVWRFDQAASASGDSGYAAFTGDGRYLGPIAFGDNPCVLGTTMSGGKLAGLYINWIKDYLPAQPPPKPKPATGLAVTKGAIND